MLPISSRKRPQPGAAGRAGLGQGHQAEELHAKFSLTHIATGDLFREHLSQETDLGKLARTYINRGELVPDDITEAMVEERLRQPDTRAGFILDGFPRTLAQAEALTHILAQLHRRVSSVVYISVADLEIETRLAGRRICRDCQTPYHLTLIAGSSRHVRSLPRRAVPAR